MAKNPSLVRSVLSWTLTPSSVMLMVPRGRPLMTAWRLPFAVVTPGSMLTKSIALRVVSGSCVICFVLIVWETADDCVWTISDEDETVICSLTPPTSIVALTLAPAADVRTTLLMTTVLNPCRVTVTV